MKHACVRPFIRRWQTLSTSQWWFSGTSNSRDSQPFGYAGKRKSASFLAPKARVQFVIAGEPCVDQSKLVVVCGGRARQQGAELASRPNDTTISAEADLTEIRAVLCCAASFSDACDEGSAGAGRACFRPASADGGLLTDSLAGCRSFYRPGIWAESVLVCLAFHLPSPETSPRASHLTNSLPSANQPHLP